MSLYRCEERPGNQIRAVYRYSEELHRNRMGNCEWLPSDGDLCVCIEHSGDCFNYYIVIRKNDDGFYEPAGKFGAYMFGDSCGELGERDFHLMQAGDPITFYPAHVDGEGS